MTPERWKRIRSAIEAALEAPSAERREAALIEACADDPALLSEARSILRVARSLHLFEGQHTWNFDWNPSSRCRR